MNNEELVENKIKEHLKNIKPSSVLFSQTADRFVTNSKIDRYNKERTGWFSYYQLINNYIMKKGILVGLPVLVLLLVGVGFLNNNNENKNQLANNQIEVLGEDVNLEDHVYVASKEEDVSSIDSIMVSFNKDIELDLYIDKQEQADVSLLSAELENYNNLNINSYEETI